MNILMESQITQEQSATPVQDAVLDAVKSSLNDHLAEDVVVIDLKGKSAIADYMIIASGRGSRQVIAMADHLVRLLKTHGQVGITPEGMKQGDWVLIDGGDIIIHLFRPEVREFYNLEKMWGVDISENDRSSG
ncbi:MAG: ribosome silencing factor [Rhodospirillales bacterium]|nr:ribosome silencing factor [Rhodospirillales bacterium]